MRTLSFVVVTFAMLNAGMLASAQAERRAAPLGTQPLSNQSGVERRTSRANATPRGAPQNRWRYRFANGRWWYWTRDNRWSYFDGNRWRDLARRDDPMLHQVDPAKLRIEYKEGVLGSKRWPRVGGGILRGGAMGGGAMGGGLPISGTQGPLGGSPSGSFTDPGGVQTGINTSTGTSTGVSGLSGAGRANSSYGLQDSATGNR